LEQEQKVPKTGTIAEAADRFGAKFKGAFFGVATG
jgi:hypothetical protein